MPQNINILFIGGAKRVSLAERFIDAGEFLGIKVNIFSYELDKNVPISAVAKVVVGLKLTDSAFFDDLEKVINTEDIHIVLPFIDPAIGFLARFKPRRPDIFIPTPDIEVCELFFNKDKSNEWLIKNNFPVPLDNQTYPKIAKPVTGSASKGIEVFQDESSMRDFEKRHNLKNFLVQRFITGDEYTVDIYITDDKRILTTVPRKRLDVTGGEVIKAMTVRDSGLIRLTNEIALKAGLRGPANIQFIKEKATGSIFVMEINTRFGGGVIASIEAGADLPKMLLMEYLGLPVEPVNDWKENLIMMRANREFFAYATDN
jgi:carbamoyl-phosphate synthase large subunit